MSKDRRRKRTNADKAEKKDSRVDRKVDLKDAKTRLKEATANLMKWKAIRLLALIGLIIVGSIALKMKGCI